MNDNNTNTNQNTNTDTGVLNRVKNVFKRITPTRTNTAKNASSITHPHPSSRDQAREHREHADETVSTGRDDVNELPVIHANANDIVKGLRHNTNAELADTVITLGTNMFSDDRDAALEQMITGDIPEHIKHDDSYTILPMDFVENPSAQHVRTPVNTGNDWEARIRNELKNTLTLKNNTWRIEYTNTTDREFGNSNSTGNPGGSDGGDTTDDTDDTSNIPPQL